MDLKNIWRSQILLALLIAGPCAAPAQPAPSERPEAREAQWNLAEIYPSPEAWLNAYQRTDAQVAALTRYRETLGRGPAAMLEALSAISDARREALRLFSYAALRADEDARVAPNQERRQRAIALGTKLDAATAWLAPEVQALGANKVEEFLAQSEPLRRRFDFLLREALRNRPHTLTLEGEALLASMGELLSQPFAVYRQLVDAELPYPTIQIDGKAVRLTQQEYERYRNGADRGQRKAVFDAFWGSLGHYQGTLGTNLSTRLMGEEFQAKARRFDSSLQQALFADDMPEAVYRTLVAEANAGLPTLHRYLRLRKRLLGIDGDMAYYDVYPPMLGRPPRTYTLDESREITLAALKPLGDEYLALLAKGTAAAWADPYPRPGKRSGAYMMGAAYDVHPYVLLNHLDDYESLTTYAHEWGHAVHTLLTQGSQPFEKSRYSTFIAESASIGNEMLLGDYMVRTAGTRDEKLFYLGQQLETIRAAFFRQVQFAEFQLRLHEMKARGEPLSGEAITEQYCRLLKRYYGEAEGVMKIDPAYCVEWTFVPHFYFGFYVWQYATSIAGAAELTERIEGADAAQARTRFIALLKAGGSDHPYTLYRQAGVDLARPEPYRALVRRMNRIMDEIEALAPPKS